MKTRRKKSQMPFADALAAANKRLVKAEKERIVAQHSLSALDAEIPALQATIAALENQLNPATKLVQPEYSYSVAFHNSVTGETTPASTMGLPITVDNLTEDDTLPEPEGQLVTPED